MFKVNHEIHRNLVVCSRLFVYINFFLGWGTNPNDPDTNNLYRADVIVHSFQKCYDYWKEFIYLNETNQLCASGGEGQNREDFCSGDSGGPLVLADSGIQIGVVSFGSDDCGSDHSLHRPGVYTRTDAHLNWINSYIENDKEEPNEHGETSPKPLVRPTNEDTTRRPYGFPYWG